MIWTIATFVEHPSNKESKLPYFIQFVPHLKPNDGGTCFVITELIKNWQFDVKTHVVADSGHGSFSVINQITQWGGVATMSLASNECQQLDKSVAYNLELNKWRAAANKQIIFSAMKKMAETTTGTTSITTKYVISSAFNYVAKTYGTINLGDDSAGKIFN